MFGQHSPQCLYTRWVSQYSLSSRWALSQSQTSKHTRTGHLVVRAVRHLRKRSSPHVRIAHHVGGWNARYVFCLQVEVQWLLQVQVQVQVQSACVRVDLKQAFDLFDRNGDGHISAQELGTVMRQLGFSPSDKEIRRMIAEVDKNSMPVRPRAHAHAHSSARPTHWTRRSRSRSLCAQPTRWSSLRSSWCSCGSTRRSSTARPACVRRSACASPSRASRHSCSLRVVVYECYSREPLCAVVRRERRREHLARGAGAGDGATRREALGGGARRDDLRRRPQQRRQGALSELLSPPPLRHATHAYSYKQLPTPTNSTRHTHTHTHTHYYTSQNSHRVIRVAFACRSTTRSSCACGSRSSVRRPHRPSHPASTSQRAHLLSSPPALLGERLRTLPSHYRFPIPSAWRMSRNVAKHRQQPQPPCRWSIVRFPSPSPRLSRCLFYTFYLYVLQTISLLSFSFLAML